MATGYVGVGNWTTRGLPTRGLADTAKGTRTKTRKVASGIRELYSDLGVHGCVLACCIQVRGV